MITSLSALIGDLILLPSLIQHIELVTLWDLIRLKLGKEPRMGIPLFKGLSRTQVHYIIMAGSLKKIEAGSILFHKGDVSDTMYTIISGTMDVVDPVSQDDSDSLSKSRILIHQLKTGDTLGEMGFLRSVPRSATVVATSPVELLQIDWKMIKRLQWLYPPTAQKFFINLLGVTCDRLENLTECFSEIKMQGDSSKLYNRLDFLKIFDTEIQRARHCCTSLSCCLLKIKFEELKSGLDDTAQDRIIRYMGNIFSEQIRDWDTLHRYDRQSYALLMPQTTIDEAQHLGNHLKRISEESILTTNGQRAKLEFGWAEFSPENDNTGVDLLFRASAGMQKISTT
jgi:CRP-like cAMP-binding protein